MSKKNVLSVSRQRLLQYESALLSIGVCNGISIGLALAANMSVFGITVGVAWIVAGILLVPALVIAILAKRYRELHEWNVREKYR